MPKQSKTLTEKQAIKFLRHVWLPRDHKLYQSHRNILEGKAGGVTIAKVLEAVGYGTGEQVTSVAYPVNGKPKRSFWVIEHDGLFFTGLKKNGKPGWAKAISRAQHYETKPIPTSYNTPLPGKVREIFTAL